MAQQLATMRTPAAYAGVAKYAHQHAGEAAAAAYLALGHAYLVDKRYAEAETSLRQARQADGELADAWTDGLLFALGGPIYAGTNEIQRNIIAERLLGLPREKAK